ncbi:BPSS1780 family membrane protein [Ideonella sp.]|uniref:BPSS1780 family membrane protein n=1 Tax=Ideonella sp. TaxID=1929293 RepID=UPI0035B27C20
MAEMNNSGLQPRSVDAGRGISWWTEGWALFMKNAGIWIVIALILVVASVVLNFIPFIGSLALTLLTPVVTGSLLLAARKTESGGALDVADIGLGFKESLNPLLVLGALLLGASVVIVVVMSVLGFGAIMGMGVSGASHSMAGMMAAAGFGLIALLVGLALFVPVAMAMWFSPALVVFHGVPPVEAARASFTACLRNIVPFLLHGIVFFVAAIIASIPFGLGWLALLPVVMLTMYISYRDVFGS